MTAKQRFLFVDDRLNFLTGEAARDAIDAKSDAAFLDETKGVVCVTRSRWEEAQRYERDTWLVAAAEASDDRNVDHLHGFDEYSAIKGRRFDRAIELGCGPFTNLRLIAQRCSIGSCTLLDPLVEPYLRHRHCAYDRAHLTVGSTALGRALSASRTGRRVASIARRLAPALLARQLPIDRLLATPIEEMGIDRTYDLVVIINVLEHCYDAERILAAIDQLLPPGGVLVFHDKLFEKEEIKKDVVIRFDAGHPLRVERHVIEAFLESQFECLYRRTETIEDTFEDIDLSRSGIYFIGTKT